MNKRSPNHQVKQAPQKPNWFQLQNYNGLTALKPHEVFSIIRDRLDILNSIKSNTKNHFQELKLQAALSRYDFIKTNPLGHYRDLTSMTLALVTKTIILTDLSEIENHLSSEPIPTVREVKGSTIFYLNDAVIPLIENDYCELDLFFEGTTPKHINGQWVSQPIDNSLEAFINTYKHYVKIDISQPKEKILSDFTKWLEMAKNELRPNTPKRENFELYRNGLARHRVIEYLDLEIYKQIEGVSVKGPVISEWLDIEVKDLEATRSKVKAIKEPKFLDWFKGFSEHNPFYF